MGGSPREQIEPVTPFQALDGKFFLGLRQLDGIDVAQIERDFGAYFPERLTALRSRIDRLKELGLVERDGARLRLAPDRLTISIEVFVELFG